ncbi:putative leucine-rich repeat domain superfamily [Dioscorea sansibarensis]
MPEWEEWIWEARDGARVMPILESLEISKCPQLKSLPKGLIHHATSLTSLCISEAHSLTVIEGFKSAKSVLLIGNNGLVRVSDLPSVHAMKIDGCPALLQDVGVLPSLETLEWGDSMMNHLPEWMLPQPISNFPMLQKMHLIVSDVPTLQRCLVNGPDWRKIQQFPNVLITVNHRQDYITYTKEPFGFVTSIGEVADLADAAPADDEAD